jgi:hypothetical protein
MGNLSKHLKNFWPFAFLIVITVIAFRPFFFQGKIPVAGDILLGQYHPWVDLRWDNFNTVFPVLNPTIPDSVFSFYAWKFKGIEALKTGNFPTYDPNTYMGHSFFATGTIGLLYPLNIIFFAFNFNTAWGLLVSSTVFLSASFFYIWLKDKGLKTLPVLIASVAYAFSAFLGLQVTFINTGHSVLWQPLVLLSIDKLADRFRLRYFILLIFALFSSLNAGFFQGSLYVFFMSFCYAVFILLQKKHKKAIIIIFLGFTIPVFLSAFQILPFFSAVSSSNRISNYGTTAQMSEIYDFLVEPKFFMTTFFPDFFGNPGKGNYFGETDTGAQVGYFEFNNFTGTVIVLGALFGFGLMRKEKYVSFFTAVFLFTLLFVSANPLSKIPYNLSLPVFSALVPSRLLVLTQFSLIVIGAYGLNKLFLIQISKKKFFLASVGLALVYLLTIITAYLGWKGQIEHLSSWGIRWGVTLRNLFIPTTVLILGVFLIFAYIKSRKKWLFAIVLLLSTAELIRHTSYFRPFIKPELIYPKTETINFLEQNLDGQRLMLTGQDLVPTNSQLIYDIKIVDGEGPIYPKKHADLMARINFSKNPEPVSQYRRMIYFRNSETSLLGLLNIRYVLSTEDLKNPNLRLVFTEGETKVYENLKSYPRVWPVESLKVLDNEIEVLQYINSDSFNPAITAVTANKGLKNLKLSGGDLKIENFKEGNGIINFKAASRSNNLLMMSEQYYPDWKLFIDGEEQKPLVLNYNLLGLYLSEGNHEVTLKFESESFETGKVISAYALLFLLLTIFTLNMRRFRKGILRSLP